MNTENHTNQDMLFQGLANALQALAIAVLDTEEKRIKAQKQLDDLSERMLSSAEHSPDQIHNYLNGLAFLGSAITFSKNI